MTIETLEKLLKLNNTIKVKTDMLELTNGGFELIDFSKKYRFVNTTSNAGSFYIFFANEDLYNGYILNRFGN